MAATSDKKLLVDLRVVELKSELERRNLDKSGMKSALLERLGKALKEEGHDPETVLIEVSELSSVQDESNHTSGPSGDGISVEGDEEEEEEVEAGREEPERGLGDGSHLDIPLGGDADVEESQQDAEISEVAEDAMVEDEEMVDEEHLLALEEEGEEEEDQPANGEDAEPDEGGEEEEDGDEQIIITDFMDVDVAGDGDGDAEVGSGGGEPVECEESVVSETSKEEVVETGADSKRSEQQKGMCAAAPAAVSGASVSSPALTTSAKPSVVKSSSVAAKKPAVATNSVVTGSKPVTASAKPVAVSKSTAPTKPSKAPTTKTAVKPVSTTKPSAGLQKPGSASSRADSASKQVSDAKASAAQKMVTSTPKPSPQASKTDGLKVADVSANPKSGFKELGQDKKASAVVAGEDSFDVQVDDTVLNEIDADLLEGTQTTREGDQPEAVLGAQVADKEDSGPQPDEPAAPDGDTSTAEQPPASASEEQTVDVSKGQDSTQKDDKKPEEKKDEKDAKPVKSGTAPTAAKPVKGKDDKTAANSRNLWVSGLSSSTRATDLKNLFGKYGKVVGAKVVTNARSPGWRCYGFVTMASADETTKCIQHLHRTELHGKMISVERFSSFKAKTGAPSKPASSSKTITGRSITGKPTSVTITTKTPAKKDEKKAPGASKDGEKKPVKKEGQKEGIKDAKKDDQSSKDKAEDKKNDKPAKKEDSRRSQSSRDRSRHRDSEKSREQRERDILSFEKIRAERERERLRQKELQLRCEERYRIAELDRERQRQKIINRKQREEAMQLEREKEKLRMEKERLEFERQEAERLRRETSRLKRIAEEKLRREQERLEEERRAIKRPAPPPKVGMGDYWGEAAKQSRKDSGFKSIRDRDFRREERREDRGGHRDMREEFSSREGHGLSGNGPVPARGHGSRDSRKMSGGHHSWGAPADSHSKADSGWGRGPQGSGESGDRWMGSSSLGSQHQRSGSSTYTSRGGGHGSRGMSSSGMYMSSGPSHSSNMMSGSGLSRQDARFNIAAITARRL